MVCVLVRAFVWCVCFCVCVNLCECVCECVCVCLFVRLKHPPQFLSHAVASPTSQAAVSPVCRVVMKRNALAHLVAAGYGCCC